MQDQLVPSISAAHGLPRSLRRSRWKSQTHTCLLGYVSLLVIGSAVWLNLAVQGDHTGSAIRRPAWAEGGRGDNRAEAMSLYVDPAFDTCGFDADGDVGVPGGCSAGEAQVHVRAKIDKTIGVANNIDGLFLTLAASADFSTWWPANAGGIRLPRESFVLSPAVVSRRSREQLEAMFMAAQLRAVEVINIQVERPAAGRVTAVDLSPLLPPMFAGARRRAAPPASAAAAAAAAAHWSHGCCPSPIPVAGTGAIHITDDVVLNTLRSASNDTQCQVIDPTGSCGGPGLPARCQGGNECLNFNEEGDATTPGTCLFLDNVQTYGCNWADEVICDLPVHNTAALCAAQQTCQWVQSASCSLSLEEFVEGYRMLRERFEPDHEIST